MPNFIKKIIFISLAIFAVTSTTTSQAQTTELYALDAFYHYFKKCYDKGDTPYFKGSNGYTIADLQEFSYAREYMLNLISLSGYSKKQLEAELAKSRPALTKRFVAEGLITCQ